MKKQPTSKEKVWKTLRNSRELLLETTFKNSKNARLLGSKNQRHEVWFKTCAQYCMLSEIWHCPLYLFPVFLLTTETLLCTNHLCPLPSLHPALIPFFTTLSLFAAETLLWAKFRTSVIQYSSLHFPHLSPTISVPFNASSYSTVFPMSHTHLLCVLLTGSCSLWEYIERKYEGIKTAPKHSQYIKDRRTSGSEKWDNCQKNAIFQTANRERLLLTINREVTLLCTDLWPL